MNSLRELLKQNTLTLIKRVVSTCYMCGDEKKKIRDKKYDFLICFLAEGGSNVLNAISLW